MQQYTIQDIQQWDRFYRANFINTLSGFRSASLIATVNNSNQPNLAIFSNIVHLGADPALIGFVNRPKEAAPHTIHNIEATGVYTINAITSHIIKQAHQTSAKYPANVSEFDATGLIPVFYDYCKAPFVQESPVAYALVLEEIIPIKQNNTFFVVGRITHVHIEKQLLQEDGFLNLQQADIITSLGIDGYYTAEQVCRLPYAKP
jgi:flavin reductase (DIM6/NTAB) family NADH-FMN oxidoreductase RutF